MKINRSEEEAVSPVIGVILMVAIVVILAAIIAAYVFGMAGSISETKNVGASAQSLGGYIIVTYQGGADHTELSSLVARSNGVDFTTGFPHTPPLVGDQSSKAYDTPGTKEHITAIATFNDGAEQVILDTYI